MKYQEKVKFAEDAAQKIMAQDATESEIRTALKNEGLYQRDIQNVLIKTKSIIGEKLKPEIRTALLEGQNLTEVHELKKIDPEVLQHIANQESKAIASEERRKVKKMLNEGVPLNKIVEQTKLKFYSKEQILLQSHNFEKLADRNSASTRTLYILGGLAMIVLGVGISYASMQSGSRGRLFYGIIIIGIITMFKGFMTVDHVDDI